MLTSNQVVRFGKEAVHNVKEVLSDAHAILISNASWSHEGLRMHQREAAKNTMGPLASLYGGRLKPVTFDVEIKGSGTAGTAPEFSEILECCGFVETVVAATSVTYDPTSVQANISSGTLEYEDDGYVHTLTGCRGNVSLNLEAGKPGMIAVTLTGHVESSVDGSLTAAYDSTVPEVYIDAPFDFGGYAAVISKLTFDMSNKLAMPPSVSAADGYGEIRITDRDVTGSFDPEATLKAANDWEALVTGNTTAALDTGVIGSAEGNRFRVQMPACRVTDLSQGDRDGIRTYEVPLQAVESSGDDQVSLAFT